MPKADSQDRLVDRLTDIESMLERQIEQLVSVPDELRTARSELGSTSDSPSPEWMSQFGRYLAPEFTEEVTAHFHDARRAALAAQKNLRSAGSP